MSTAKRDPSCSGILYLVCGAAVLLARVQGMQASCLVVLMVSAWRVRSAFLHLVDVAAVSLLRHHVQEFADFFQSGEGDPNLKLVHTLHASLE